MDGYHAFITPPGGNPADPLGSSTDIFITKQHGLERHVLTMSDKGWFWMPLSEASSPPPASLSLPTEAMEALLDAVDRYKGAPSHARTETAVLREWLKSEQTLRDNLLTSILPPRIIDMGQVTGLPLTQTVRKP